MIGAGVLWVNAANPDSLNAWITSHAYSADAANIAAVSAALRP